MKQFMTCRGAAPFKKYVPHGEEAFAIIDAIDAVTNNRTDGILNNRYVVILSQ